MALGPDAHPTADAIAHYNRRVAENRARAAQVTGRHRIFNDAALAVEKISTDVQSYWRRGVSRIAPEPAEKGIIRGLISAAGHLINKEPETIGNAEITADIGALENLMNDLPPEEAERCRSVVAKTRAHIDLERKIVKLDRQIDGIPASPYTPAGVYGAMTRIDLHFKSMFGSAAARGQYQESCENLRNHLFQQALAP